MAKCKAGIGSERVKSVLQEYSYSRILLTTILKLKLTQPTECSQKLTATVAI